MNWLQLICKNYLEVWKPCLLDSLKNWGAEKTRLPICVWRRWHKSQVRILVSPSSSSISNVCRQSPLKISAEDWKELRRGGFRWSFWPALDSAVILGLLMHVDACWRSSNSPGEVIVVTGFSRAAEASHSGWLDGQCNIEAAEYLVSKCVKLHNGKHIMFEKTILIYLIRFVQSHTSIFSLTFYDRRRWCINIYTNLWSGKGKWRETSSFERDVGCLATRGPSSLVEQPVL